MILACEEHLERALEDFTMERQAPPDLFMLEQVETPILADSPCAYCDSKAVYVVKGYAD